MLSVAILHTDSSLKVVILSQVIAVNEADSGEGLCTLTIDLEHCSTEPISKYKRCVVM